MKTTITSPMRPPDRAPVKSQTRFLRARVSAAPPSAAVAVARVDVKESLLWENWHNSVGVGGKVLRQLTPQNGWVKKPNDFKPWWDGMAGIKALQQIVRAAEADKKQVRAFGGSWSLNNVAFTNEYHVNSTNLAQGLWFTNDSKNPIKWMLDAEATVDARLLVFAQAGTRISTLHTWLEANGLSLPTCGASNGQTIIGAISTGTHGAAHAVGAMQDYAVGLHVIGEGGEQFWIERKSQPIVSKTFCDSIGATLRRDDDLFDAAIVGFGCFGLVHGVLLEVVPIYLLERFVYRRDFDAAVRNAMTLPIESWKTTASALKLPSEEVPYHFEIVMNPYRLEKGDRGVFVRVFYKRPVADPTKLPPARVPEGQTLSSKELVGFVGVISDGLPASVIGAALQGQMNESIVPTAGLGVLGTCSQQFGDSERTGRGTSVEIGVPRSRAAEAVNLILKVTKQIPFGAPIALRYVKASRALLAFTRFEDITCAIELPGLGSNTATEAHRGIFKAFAESGIPHTYHWGQVLPENRDWIRKAFGSRLDRWLDARKSFLSTPAARRMFSNSMIERCGLTEVVGP